MLRQLLPAIFSITFLSTAFAGADAHSSDDSYAGHGSPASSATSAVDEPKTTVDADTALMMLKDGNARFVQGESTFPNLDQDRRCLTTDGGQHPYASVLSCADSRVPPELLFDAGIGELFVIRVAGNVADTDEIGTLEYGAGHLKTPLIVVMGHTRCGAVTAVVKGAEVGGSIPKLVDNIVPAVETAREKHAAIAEAKFIGFAIKENVRQAMADVLRNSEEIRALVAAGEVKIVGAVYDIHNGTIEWLGELPNQTAILEGTAAEQGHDADELVHADAHSRADSHAGEDSRDKPSPGAKPTARISREAHDDPHAIAASKRTAPGKDAHEEDAHPTPKKPAGKEAHGTPSRKAPAHDDKPAGKPSHDDADAHGSDHGSDHDDPHAHADGGKVTNDAHADAAEKKSLVEKHGLLVPGAFLAAGSVLSGTVVFLLKGKTSASKTVAAEAPAESKPAH